MPAHRIFAIIGASQSSDEDVATVGVAESLCTVKPVAGAPGAIKVQLDFLENNDPPSAEKARTYMVRSGGHLSNDTNLLSLAW